MRPCWAAAGPSIRFSRYQTAGRAITLLACLVMPLNLWFYHANQLITLEGHLWVAALVCCVLYLASALVLRDQLFVYVLNGGIAMTGLLMLADAGRFWEIASPAALLVVLGLLSIHAERAFAEVEGPFGRRRFGLAFFQSGQVLLAAGLLLVLGAQLAGDWLYRPLFQATLSAVGTSARRPSLPRPGASISPWPWCWRQAMPTSIPTWWCGGWGCTSTWACSPSSGQRCCVIELVADKVPTEAAIIALALTGLAANLLQPRLLRRQQPLPSDAKQDSAAAAALSLVRAGQPLGLFLSTVPVLLGLVLHLRATYKPLNDLWLLSDGGHYAVAWTYVVAMFVTAVSCRIGAHLYRHALPWLSSVYFVGTAAATLTGLAGLCSAMGHPDLGPNGPAADDRPHPLPAGRPALPRSHARESPGVGCPCGHGQS